MSADTSRPDDDAAATCDALRAAAAGGDAALLAALVAELSASRRWHALFDARLLEARVALGLPLAGESRADPAAQAALEARSLDACREAGWPLLEEGKVAAGWMYLRAAAEPAEVAARLGALADRVAAEAAAERGTGGADPFAEAHGADATLQEIIHVALWEGVAPDLGLRLLLERNGTCNTITAYEQAVSRLPAARQRPAADLLVAHLHRELRASLLHDLERRGVAVADGATIPAILEAAGGMRDDPSVHLDVSHLHSVLRIARVCTSRESLGRAWEMARYACRLPKEAVYAGEAPFEEVGEASRLFFGAQLGHDVEPAVAFFRRAAVLAKVERTGSLPGDVLVLLLARLSRPAEALHAALDRAPDSDGPSLLQATGMLPTLLELAAASGEWETLRQACRRQGDAITYAATILEERRRG